MGTAVWIEKAEFRMSASAERAALVALKSAFPTEASFLAHRIHEQPAAYHRLIEARTLADALRSVIGLGDHILVHSLPGGGISSIGREGMMDELPARAIARFFAPIARFIEPDSYIEFESDRGSSWTRVDFRKGVVRVIECELGIDEAGEWNVIEHDRTALLRGAT